MKILIAVGVIACFVLLVIFYCRNDIPSLLFAIGLLMINLTGAILENGVK